MATTLTPTERLMRDGRCVLCRRVIDADPAPDRHRDPQAAELCDGCHDDADLTIHYCPDCGVTYDAAGWCDCPRD